MYGEVKFQTVFEKINQGLLVTFVGLAGVTPSNTEDLEDVARKLGEAVWRAYNSSVPYERKRMN